MLRRDTSPLKHDRFPDRAGDWREKRERAQGKPVTICLAAMCNVAQGASAFIVGAADRMITIGDIEYEPDQTKLVWLATHTAILLAGEMRLHAVACTKVMRKLQAGELPGFLIRDIAEAYAQEFAAFRRYNAEREILTPLNLTIDKFTSNQSGMSRDFILEITQKLQRYQIDAPSIIAGFDTQGVHLLKVVDPGVVIDCGTECFAAIGIGEWHAESQFMVSSYSKQWGVSNALELACVAKLRAETNAGVGKKTDVFMIGKGGGYNFLPQEIKSLDAAVRAKDKRDARSEKLAVEQIHEKISSTVQAYSVERTQSSADSSKPTTSDNSQA